MDGRVENRRMDWGKHKEVKLVHEVKMEVDSRDEDGDTAWTMSEYLHGFHNTCSHLPFRFRENKTNFAVLFIYIYSLLSLLL